MDFVGNALAPNVLTIANDLEDLSRRRERRGEPPLAYVFPNRGDRRVAKGARRRSQLLDVERDYGPVGLQASFGFGPFLDAAARAASFCDPLASLYEAVAPARVSRLFSDAGIIPDEAGDGRMSSSRLVVYAVSPFVLLVDERGLDGRPVPRGWEDVLDRRYRGAVVMTAEDPAENAVSLGVHALFGDDGLEALLSNVCYSSSASVMGMIAGTGGAGPGRIFAAPWFFARICAARAGVRVVWPREGALVLPLWLALRKDAGPAAREVADYFLGAAYARASAALCMPCACAASDECVPGYPAESRNLAWVGWDYLRTLDVAAYEGLAQAAGASIPRVNGSQEARSL